MADGREDRFREALIVKHQAPMTETCTRLLAACCPLPAACCQLPSVTWCLVIGHSILVDALRDDLFLVIR
jgi:hypothetical protein